MPAARPRCRTPERPWGSRAGDRQNYAPPSQAACDRLPARRGGSSRAATYGRPRCGRDSSWRGTYVVSPAMATGNRWSAAGDSTAGDSTAGDSTAGEGRLVVAGLAVLVDEVGALVVLLFAVVVRLLRALLVFVIVVVAVAQIGRASGRERVCQYV